MAKRKFIYTFIKIGDAPWKWTMHGWAFMEYKEGVKKKIIQFEGPSSANKEEWERWIQDKTKELNEKGEYNVP